MCVGEKRRIKIPPKLAYGDEGSPPKIPGMNVIVTFPLQIQNLPTVDFTSPSMFSKFKVD